MRLNTVVLPAPFGPMILTVSPALTVKLSESTAISPPNRLVRFLTSSRNTLRFPRFQFDRSSKTTRQPAGHEEDHDNQQRAIDQEICLRKFISEDFRG